MLQNLTLVELLYISCFTICIGRGVCILGADNVYDTSVLDYNKKEVSLQKFSGKVTLIVNVASQCGYTEGTYKALTRLHDILSYGNHFSVLAFPCNQFGEQEPNEAPEIVEAAEEQFGVEFPIFDKIDVIGANASPLFKKLIAQSSVVPDWNFYKYLVNGSGEVLNAWKTTTTIEEIFDEVQRAVQLAQQTGKAIENAKREEEGGKDEEVDRKDEL